VQQFTPMQLISCFESMDGEAAASESVRNIRAKLKQQVVAEPPGSNRAVTLPSDDQQWLELYPDWFQPFRAGRLFDYPEVWEAVWAEHGQVLPKKLKSWLYNGYSVKVHHQFLAKQPGRNKLCDAEFRFATQQLQEWVEMGAIEEVALPTDPNIRVCNMVIAYRNGIPDRVCWSGGPINSGVVVDKFKMETLHKVCQVMKPGDYAFALDFKKGFMQVPLKRPFREYTYMCLRGKCYRWKVLMFGLATAPKDFSYIVKKVLGLLRQQGVRNAFFIDDIIHFASTKEAAMRLREQVLGLLYRLGFFVSWKKSLLEPGQLIQHLGLDVCTVDRSIWVPEYKTKEVIHLASSMLEHCRCPVPGRAVSRLVGKLMSMRLAIPGVIILTKGLVSCLGQLETIDTVETSSGQLYTIKDYEGDVWLTELAIEELRLWVQCIWTVRGTPFRDVVDVYTFVDACPTGGGAVVVERKWALPDDPLWQVSDLRAGAWEQRMNVHSTAFELLNMGLTVNELGHQWENRTVQILTDNVGAAFIAGRGCMKNAALHAVSLMLWEKCLEHRVQLCFQYLAGDGIIAAGADGLSRDSDYADCMLRQWAFRLLWDREPMQVDLFCSPSTVQNNPYTGTQLQAVSPYFISGQVGRDGLLFVSHLVLYAFPPSSVLMPLLSRVHNLGLRCVVVGPVWSDQPWWHWVAALPASKRCKLGKVQSCTVQKVSNGQVPHRVFQA
jgi:Reverse transcriptase (RNA-dependent DNA polymerase)